MTTVANERMDSRAAAKVSEMLVGGQGVLIDVRTPLEYRQVHAVGAINVPLDGLSGEKVKAVAGGKQVCVICKSGARAAKACAALSAEGMSVIHVEGGTDAWVAAGLPAERQKVMSLERQVRIAAGAIVLTGVVLGFAVHPGFFGLSGFVGVGLIVAGITDWCGMGMLIAKMPWNK